MFFCFRAESFIIRNEEEMTVAAVDDTGDM